MEALEPLVQLVRRGKLVLGDGNGVQDVVEAATSEKLGLGQRRDDDAPFGATGLDRGGLQRLGRLDVWPQHAPEPRGTLEHRLRVRLHHGREAAECRRAQVIDRSGVLLGGGTLHAHPDWCRRPPQQHQGRQHCKSTRTPARRASGATRTAAAANPIE